MASTRIREAREADCGDILRMIRVKTGLENGVPWGWEQRGGRGRVRKGACTFGRCSQGGRAFFLP